MIRQHPGVLNFRREKITFGVQHNDSLLCTYILDSQKMIFLDTPVGVATTLRPYWTEATRDRATVVQAVPDMLEIVPHGTSKGSGVKILLDHLGITAEEVWTIHDCICSPIMFSHF